jgi:protein SEY1
MQASTTIVLQSLDLKAQERVSKHIPYQRLNFFFMHNYAYAFFLKGTLLNRLFGTTFDVMDETQRRQTTKGIWMSRGRGMGVLVMDVEGTDGRERGEDQDFERKSALFSMATSEVIILNLWEHQVGLYQGANMGLLKTVFEVNLQLFQSQRG